IRQNSYHIKMLKENCPGLDSVKVKSLICLVSGGNVDVETKVPIAGPFGVRKKIMQMVSIEKAKNNPVEIKKLIDRITLPAKQAASRHKNMLAVREGRLRKGLCPRCSAKLFRKRGMRGEYYICSNFPACKFRISYRK
ncbi:MAG: topoisomerase DNA-binding C4 zinc finger domain-containing protein, partial [Clostridia bacterium]|nr:topoisomerase DNA-binding C4 zinc finger domain-containing protein [Clostridia bacterium]